MRRLVAALCALAVCLGSQENPFFEVTGVSSKEVTLVPEVNGNLTDISWKKGENLVADLEWFAPSLNGRTELNKTSGALTFAELYQNDTGNYTAEAVVEGKYQYTDFWLRVLEHPAPPLVNCTDAPNGFQVRCEVDVQYVAQNTNPTYRWEYQKSREPIGGNTSVILIPKPVDPSEIITCIIGVYDAEANGSVSLSVCVLKGAVPRTRNRVCFWLPIGFALVAGVAYGCWKRALLIRLLLLF